MQHLQFMANTNGRTTNCHLKVQQQIQQSMQQAQQMPPQEQQGLQLQIQSILEGYSSPILAQLSNEFLSSVQPPQQEDPLVAIRQQELGLRDKEIDMKNQQFMAKEQQDAMEQGTELQLQQQKG